MWHVSCAEDTSIDMVQQLFSQSASDITAVAIWDNIVSLLWETYVLMLYQSMIWALFPDNLILLYANIKATDMQSGQCLCFLLSGKYYNRVPMSSRNHGKPGKKSSIHGKVIEFEKT